MEAQLYVSSRASYRAHLMPLLVMCLTVAGGLVPAHAASNDRPEIHALVVGIDHYQHVESLHGAVNDANDVNAALLGLGAKVRLLIGPEVTKTRLMNEWHAMMTEATPGSILIFLYSGHSTMGHETPRPDEPDGEYDFLVLSDFSAGIAPEKQPEQIVTGHQWRGWIKEASSFRVITVYDSCTSARMYRSVQHPSEFGVRSPLGIRDALLAPPVELAQQHAIATAEVEILPNQIFIAGAEQGVSVIEVPIEGKARGALSYYFARALRGEADRNRDGKLSIGELFDYVGQGVRKKTETQYPVFLTRRTPGENLFLVHAPPPHDDAPLPIIRVGVESRPAWLVSLEGAVIVGKDAPAFLRYNSSTNDLSNAAGQIVAQFNDVTRDAQPTALQHSITKWRYVEAIGALSEGKPLSVKLQHSEQWFRPYPSPEPRFDFSELRPTARLLLFNLASDGKIQLVYPTKSNDKPTESTKSIRPQVTEPFGADHLIAIETLDEAGFLDLWQWLRSRDQSFLNPDGSLLKRIQTLRDARIGVQYLYTTSAEGLLK
jgi:caspase domain-containing protein